MRLMCLLMRFFYTSDSNDRSRIFVLFTALKNFIPSNSRKRYYSCQKIRFECIRKGYESSSVCVENIIPTIISFGETKLSRNYF